MDLTAALAAIRPEAYPAGTTTAHEAVAGIPTSAMFVRFGDRDVVTVVQDGIGITQWIEIPPGSIDSNNPSGPLPASLEYQSDDDDDAGPDPALSGPLALLPPVSNIPLAHSLLGAGNFQRETSTHFIGRQIAALSRASNGNDSKPLLVGFGWKSPRGIDIGPSGKSVREDLFGLVIQLFQ